MVKKKAMFLSSLMVLTLFASACQTSNANNDLLRIGHSGGYLSAAVYAADFDADFRQLYASSDIAYSLLADSLDVGFVEAEKLAAFTSLEGFERLTVAGTVTYPFGATLVLRKGLDVRLQELSGLTIAASEPDCSLLEAFIEDAERLGADISHVDFEFMPFHTMLPALEAGVVDAAIIRGSYSVVARSEGHTILYQNWDVEAGDECCPAIIDQAALVLLVQRDKSDKAVAFVDALIETQALSPDELRRVVADNTTLSFELLQGEPVPTFSVANDELLDIFAESESHHNDEQNEGDHDD